MVSTIFTQANQYRVVLEVKPEFQQGAAALDGIYVHIDAVTRGAAGAPQVPLVARFAAR